MKLPIADHKALNEIRQYARETHQDELAHDCTAALQGDRDAFGHVLQDVLTRHDLVAWRPVRVAR